MEGGSKWGHSGRETSSSGANEHSQRDEQLLVGPDRSLWGQVRDPQKETGSLTGGQGAGEDGMCEGLWGFRAQREGRVSIKIVPRGVSREVTFPRAHLVYPPCDKLTQTHQGMGACCVLRADRGSTGELGWRTSWRGGVV